jgi:hypothetical protein
MEGGAMAPGSTADFVQAFAFLGALAALGGGLWASIGVQTTERRPTSRPGLPATERPTSPEHVLVRSP